MIIQRFVVNSRIFNGECMYKGHARCYRHCTSTPVFQGINHFIIATLLSGVHGAGEPNSLGGTLTLCICFLYSFCFVLFLHRS